MKSIQRPRQQEYKQNGDFAHSSVNGNRVPGWEDTNIKQLANSLGKSPQHIREILTGRKDTRLRMIAELAHTLSMPEATLIDRIRKAQKLDEERLLNELNVIKAKLKSRMKARAAARTAITAATAIQITK